MIPSRFSSLLKIIQNFMRGASISRTDFLGSLRLIIEYIAYHCSPQPCCVAPEFRYDMLEKQLEEPTKDKEKKSERSRSHKHSSKDPKDKDRDRGRKHSSRDRERGKSKDRRSRSRRGSSRDRRRRSRSRSKDRRRGRSGERRGRDDRPERRRPVSPILPPR